MKKAKHILLAFLLLALSSAVFTGCEKTSSQIEAESQEAIRAKNIEDVGNYTQEYFATTMKTATYEQFRLFLESGQHLVSIPFDHDWGYRWGPCNEAHGEVKEAAVDLTERTDDGYTSRIILTGEDQQQMAFTITYDKSLTPVSTAIADFSDDSNETLGSKMAVAAGNTATGLIVVFAILILLSLIIASFKFVNQIAEKKPENKDQTAAPKAAPAKAAERTGQPAVSQEEIDLAANQQLVAVLTAAIAAYEEAAGTATADGYVVRSIRRLKSNKWR